MVKFKAFMVAALMALAFTFAPVAPANAGPGGNITRAGYTNNPGYGPNLMYMNCIGTNGVGKQVGVAVFKNTAFDYGCSYVTSVYVPAGGWKIECNGVVKWQGEGWHSWPGNGQLTCLWK